MNLIGTILGVLGVAANILIYQQKDRQRLLLWKLSADAIWLLHYGALGAWSGAAICAIGVIREIVFLNNHRKWAMSKLWLVLFLILGAASAAATWKNAFSVLPALASSIAVVSFWIGRPQLTRILQLPISGSLLVYNVICGSYAGIVNEVLVLASIGVRLCIGRKKA